MHTRAHTPKQEPSLLRSQCGFVPSVKFFLFRHTFIYIHFPVLCEPHYISRGKNSGKVAAISFIPNRFSFRFSTSRTNGSRSLSQTKASTHSAFGEKSHTSAYTAKHGAFRMGALLLPSERSTRFGNPAWPGFKTANFAAFGSWSETLLKNAESLGTAMRSCVSLFRGVAAPLGCVIFFASAEIAVCTSGAHGFPRVRGMGGITTLGALCVLLKYRTAACQNGSFAVF